VNRKVIILLSVLMLLILMTTTVLAARMKLLDVTLSTEETSSTGGGPRKEIIDIIPFEAASKGKVIIMNDLKPLFAGGRAAGLGTLDLTVKLEATATTVGDIICTNHGQQTVEAQPREFKLVSIQVIPSKDFDKNGSVLFSLASGEPTSQLSSGQLCPNDNWTAKINLAWTEGTVTATLPDGQSDTVNFTCPLPDAEGNTTCQ